MDVLNPLTVETFRELMGTEELQAFYQEARQELLSAQERLRQLQSEGNWFGVKSQAHRLKGTMGSLGCDALYEVLNALEARLEDQPDVIPSEDDMRRIHSLIDQSAQALASAGL